MNPTVRQTLFILSTGLFSQCHTCCFQIPLRDWLESVSCPNLDSNLEAFSPIVVPTAPRTAESFLSAATDRSTLPLFLQDQGTLGGTKELLEKMQVGHITEALNKRTDSEVVGGKSEKFLSRLCHILDQFLSLCNMKSIKFTVYKG